VLVTARKLNDLEVVDAELAEPVAVEEPVRPLSAAELVVAAEHARAVVALPGTEDDYGIDLDVECDENHRLSG